jgi:ceramide glucosyltransferase
MLSIHSLVAACGYLCLILAACYSVLTLIAAAVWRHRIISVPSPQPRPATVLKPLCNDEPHLYEHLRTFCQQDFTTFQLVFGVRDVTDPALRAVRRLVAEFPLLQIDVVVDPALHGRNYKISNLINMVGHARYDVLVIADSDTWVGPEYLASVTAPLHDPAVSLVTCIYRGVPTARISSQLGAMYVNEWYMPSVLLARLFGFQGYVSGQTLCLRRDTLEAIGGFKAIANHLADDYRLGELVRALGLEIVMSRYLVAAQHDEENLTSLFRHELRWMRTLRVLRPRSFPFLFLSFSLLLASSGLLLCLAQPVVPLGAGVLFWITVVARLLLHFMQRAPAERALLGDLWLLPVREILIFAVWCGCFFNSRVLWRGQAFDVDADGIMR